MKYAKKNVLQIKLDGRAIEINDNDRHPGFEWGHNGMIRKFQLQVYYNTSTSEINLHGTNKKNI